MTGAPTRHADTLIFPASLDPNAVTVVKRLLDAGLEAYLVGGCVRDLLLGLIPKDFDISTEARPRQIRRLFRNSRIIGRRFKLAHVHFGDKIVEVATFRRSPEGSGEPGVQVPDLLITRDNEFGNAEEDVLRRDFTINALLYDVRSEEVIDYVGGVQDLNDRVLRTIGDPMVRFAEDPVRMLRAVKFMSRLGLSPAPDVDAAMRASADTILRSAPPRVLEEIFKLMSCGRAVDALDRFVEYGLLRRLLPEIAPWWEAHREELRAVGAALDLVDRGRRVVSNAFLMAVLWERPWRAALEQGGPDAGAEAAAALHGLLDPAALRMSIPRRDVAGVRHVFQTMLRLETGRRGRRGRMGDFLGRPTTRDAVQLLHVLARAGCVDPELHAAWAQRVAELAPDASSQAGRDDADDERGPGRSRRRGRRGGRRRGGRGRRGRRDDPSPGGEHDGAEADETAEARGDDQGADDDGHGRIGDGASPPEDDREASGGRRGRSRRRRRRRRSSGGGDGSGTGPDQDAPAGAAADAAASDADAKAARSSSEGGERGRSRGRGGSRRRRRREPSGSSSQRGGSGSSGSSGSGGDDGANGSRGGGKGGGGGRGSALREHPEDVEDLFDW